MYHELLPVVNIPDSVDGLRVEDVLDTDQISEIRVTDVPASLSSISSKP
jgi:hypothetical protein